MEFFWGGVKAPNFKKEVFGLALISNYHAHKLQEGSSTKNSKSKANDNRDTEYWS